MKEKGNNTLFVTGTDTSVGKTYVCARLLEFLNAKGIQAGYQKWVATGVKAGLPEDLALCLKAASISPKPELVKQQAPYCFSFPASPHLAAEMEDRTVDSEVIEANYKFLAAKYEWLIVEGVGGIMVPLRRNLLLADLLKRLQPRTLVVARSGLGTLNHTLLTLEALRNREIPVLGVVFSDSKDREDERLVQDNMKIIEEIGMARVFGRLPRQQNDAKARSAFMPVGQAIWEQLLHDES
ncbi:MAG: dethiobiotin synthase [Desulfobulbaceae bacterium]|jgi:dethiobiotin synthetase|nr:dethiobiotin synthase [Desulfobulbaceae bacterium]MDH3866226.1 dethiobiotin synthase [Desulfobulbaceae bacterium]PLX46995.1 MAG: dethiobiotin synthase [Desulfobulbaceae bacterium]HKJ15586.1 dethiobiotin synthase [Desulfobulbales bacterium]